MTSRRTFLKGAVASGAVAKVGGFPLIARAQAPEVKVGIVAIVAGMLTPKYFGKGIKTVAGIGNDYSYGHDCWETYQAVLKKYIPDVKFVLELFPKLGVTDFTSHIASIQQSKADLLMCSFWSGDATIILKQAAAVSLFKTMKDVFTTAGGVHDSLKKEFTPEGLLLGY